MPKIKSTTNDEPAHDDLKQRSKKSNQSKDNLKEGSEKPSPRKVSMEAVEEACHKNCNKKK